MVMRKVCSVFSFMLGFLALAIATFLASCTSSEAPRTAPAASTREVSPLQLSEEVPIPSVPGRLDHFTGDPKRRLLIFSALGNNSVEVVNTFDGRQIHSIKGLNEPQGPLYVPEFDKLFVANAGSRAVNIYDGKTYALLKTLEIGKDPDNVRWDEVSKRVFVGYDGAIAMIDPATNTHVDTDLKTAGGHAESFQLEKKGTRIFVNVPDDGQVVEAIDRKTGAVTKWEFTGARGNYAMALDEDNHRLFTITRKPPLMIVFNTETGKEVTRLPCAGESDDVYFDATRKRIYVVGAQGFISVFQQKDPDHYELVENVPTTVGARTGYFFVSRDRFYLGIPAKGNEPAQVWTFEAED